MSDFVEAICRAICKVEALNPDSPLDSECEPNWVRYADAVNQVLLARGSEAPQPESLLTLARAKVESILTPDPNHPCDDTFHLHFPGAVEEVEGREFWQKHLTALLVEFGEAALRGYEAPQQWHDGDCHICKERTSSVAGDPGKWPIWLGFRGGNGKTRPYHMRCIIKTLEVAELRAPRTTEPAQEITCPECNSVIPYAPPTESRQINYYRAILQRIANGYETPKSLARFALDHEWEPLATQPYPQEKKDEP